MITQPTENISLDDGQQAQLKFMENRLTNLKTEVSVEVKKLTELRLDCENFTKDREYNEKILNETLSKVKRANEEYETLCNKISEGIVILDTNTQKANEISVIHDSKAIELKDKEYELNQSIENHQKEVEIFTNKSKELSEEKENLAQAKDAFLKAIDTVTWK